MQDLPIELLPSIFRQTILLQHELNSQADSNRQKDLKALCLVCKVWKDVVYNCPELWVLVAIGRCREPDARVARLLNRTGDHPLDIMVLPSSDLHRMNTDYRDDYDQALKVLKSEKHRWRTLCLWAQDGVDDLLWHAPQDLPVLVEARIMALRRPTSQQEDEIHDIKPTIIAPNLRRFTTNSAAALARFQMESLRYCHFTAELSSLADLPPVMEHIAGTFRQLLELEIGYAMDPVVWRDLHPWPEMPALRSLMMDNCESHVVLGTLKRLQAPALQLVKISALLAGRSVPRHVLEGMSPKRLQFYNCYVEDIYRLVFSLPSPSGWSFRVDETTTPKPDPYDSSMVQHYQKRIDWLDTFTDFCWI